MRQVPLERDINIAVNGCSGFATSTQKGPFMAMLISRSRGTYLIGVNRRFCKFFCVTLYEFIKKELMIHDSSIKELTEHINRRWSHEYHLVLPSSALKEG